MTKNVEIKEPKEEVSSNAGNESAKPRDKKDKASPHSKIVIRRLPPTMTKDQFLEQISPVPDHDYFNYVAADYSLGQNSFCTAYLNFIKQDDIFIFRDKFDNYVFLDAKGNEFAAVVEFAPFQKIPKKKSWKDAKCGTIEQDAEYKAFLESIQNPAEVALPSIESYLEEIETKEKELKANHGVPNVKTPLLEYVKQRKIEKQRIRDEKREDRRRRDIERRKQREDDRRRRKYDRERQIKEKNIKRSDNLKDYRSDNSDSDTVVKVLKNPERKPEEKSTFERPSSANQFKKNDKGSSRQSENKNTESRKDKMIRKKLDKPHYKEDEEKLSRGNKSEPTRKRNKSKPSSIESKTSEKSKVKLKLSKSEKEEPVESKGNFKDQKSNTNPKKNDKSSENIPVSTDNTDSQKSEIPKKTQNLDLANSEITDAHTSKSPCKTDEECEKAANSIKDKSEQVAKTEDNEPSEKESRKEKRIRNKDRPSMELYRPGMRRLAKHSASSSPQKEVSPSSSSSPSPTLQMNKQAKGKTMKEDNSDETEKQ